MIEARAWRKWLLLLSGPVLWAAHFAVSYAASGLDYTFDGHAGPGAHLTVLIAGMLALAVQALLLRAAWHMHNEEWSANLDLARFWRRSCSVLLLLTSVAIVCQTLPVLFVTAAGEHDGSEFQQAVTVFVQPATAHGASHLWLDVMASAEWARRAYAGWGFREIGTARFEKGVREELADMVVMVRELA